MNTTTLIQTLKAEGQDHEFYPTTDEIIKATLKDITRCKDEHWRTMRECQSVLDIGAGNGKVLRAFKAAGFTGLHAIEKSPILCRALDAEILIVGTEFHEQSLFSKAVDVMFCNPPYSEFEDWSEKIIRQSAANVVYLVIPMRWEKSTRITDAIKFRAAKVHKVGTFDFEDAEDRKARAHVHLLRIMFDRQENDAFALFFEEQFADLIAQFKGRKADEDKESEEPKDEHFSELVVGPNYPEALVGLYNQEIENIKRNYHAIGQLDAGLLKEFQVDPQRIMKCLRERLKGLKNKYWSELFSHLSAVTDRLTSKSRQKLLRTLHQHVEVDFTVTNILEVIVWVIKNANIYIDQQLLEIYDLMVDKCNVVMYASNKRTWQDDRWRYNGDAEKNSHYALDYRIVCHRAGGMSFSYTGRPSLDECAADFIGDLMTLARNLGFKCTTNDARLNRSGRDHWKGGEKQVFTFTNKDGTEELLDVRAYKNRNIHVRLNTDFILALNVEHGRLRGWINSPQEAVDELKDANAAKHFKTNTQLLANGGRLLLT